MAVTIQSILLILLIIWLCYFPHWVVGSMSPALELMDFVTVSLNSRWLKQPLGTLSRDMENAPCPAEVLALGTGPTCCERGHVAHWEAPSLTSLADSPFIFCCLLSPSWINLPAMQARWHGSRLSTCQRASDRVAKSNDAQSPLSPAHIADWWEKKINDGCLKPPSFRMICSALTANRNETSSSWSPPPPIPPHPRLSSQCWQI